MIPVVSSAGAPIQLPNALMDYPTDQASSDRGGGGGDLPEVVASSQPPPMDDDSNYNINRQNQLVRPSMMADMDAGLIENLLSDLDVSDDFMPSTPD
jgi:hypothetical protein